MSELGGSRSKIDAIIVKGGPHSGLWFRSVTDRDRFLQCPQIVKAESHDTTPMLGSLSLRVADAETWEWLNLGVMLNDRGCSRDRSESVNFSV
jgi:hypothetical protein